MLLLIDHEFDLVLEAEFELDDMVLDADEEDVTRPERTCPLPPLVPIVYNN